MKSIYAIIIAIALSSCCERAHANPEYIAMTRAAEVRYGIPLGLLGGICEQESHWDPNAIGSKQEIGLCQLKQDTAADHCPKCANRKYLLLLGVDDPRVLMVKRKLTKLKYYSGPLDTTFDDALFTAVENFQTANKLTVDGSVGDNTWFKLFGKKRTGNSLLDMLYDPETNIDLAARFLAYLMTQLKTHDYEFLAAAYNAGEAGSSVDYIKRIRKNVAKQTLGLAQAPRFN